MCSGLRFAEEKPEDRQVHVTGYLSETCILLLLTWQDTFRMFLVKIHILIGSRLTSVVVLITINKSSNAKA